MPILKKLIKVISLLLCGVMIIFNVSCSYNNLSSKNKVKISSFSQQFMQQVSLNISNQAEKIEDICMDISFSQQIQDGLKGYSKADEYEKLLFLREIQNTFLINFITLASFINAEIITNEGVVLTCMDSNYSKQTELIAQASNQQVAKPEASIIANKKTIKTLLKEVNTEKGMFLWKIVKRGTENSIVCCRNIIDFTSGEKSGTLIVELKESYLGDILKTINLGVASNIFVIDENGIVLASQNKEIKIGNSYPDDNLLQKISKDKYAYSNSFIEKVGKIDNIVAYSYMRNLEWCVVANLPLSQFN